jgi:hypothetical protein
MRDQIGLQTVARLFVASLRTGQRTAPRATVITTLSAGTLLPILRDTFKAQLVAQGQEPGKGNELLKRFLETISISRIFDMSGLWEALEELSKKPSSHEEPPRDPHSSQRDVNQEDIAASKAASADERDEQGETSTAALSSSPLSDPPSSLPDEMEFVEAQSRKPPPGEREEIADSEDEDEGGLLSPFSQPKASCEPGPAGLGGVPEGNITKSKGANVGQPDINPPEEQAVSRCPDIVLITHMSTILSALFRLREKDTAHQTVQLLSSHLHYLSHSPDRGGPLTIVLNSTTSAPQEASSSGEQALGPGQGRPSPPPHPPQEAPNTRGPNTTLDPTLRSIFNPPALPAAGLGYAHNTTLYRRNKPSYGLIFTQMLDMHLLCSRVARTRADAEALFAPERRAAGNGATDGRPRYCWVVEVLLDEIGVWEGEGAARRPLWGTKRASREQRWGAVDVRMDGQGSRVVDAFGAE